LNPLIDGALSLSSLVVIDFGYAGAIKDARSFAAAV
jgi:hypothetical protein